MKSYTRLSLLAALLVPLVSDSMFGQWSTSLNAAVPGNFVGTTNSEDLTLRTFGADRIRIDNSTGFVRIGTTTPSITPARRLHLFYASTTPQLRLEDPNGFWDIRGGDNLHITDDNGVDWLKCDAVSGVLKVGQSDALYIDDGGSRWVGIGTSTLHSMLTVDGTITPSVSCTHDIGSSLLRWDAIWACNGTIQTSDASMKENIRELSYGIADVMKLNPISFTWKNNPAEGTKLGFIAQELQPVLNEVVKMGDDGLMGVLYSDMIPVLVKAMQDQDAELSKETAENDRLRAELKEQENRLARLEATLSAANND